MEGKHNTIKTSGTVDCVATCSKFEFVSNMLGAVSVAELPFLSSKFTTSFLDSWLFKMSPTLTSELITGFTVSVEGTRFG